MTAPTQGLHSLSTIIKRLEAVTSRLEDVAQSQSSPAPTSSLRSPTTASHDILAGHVAPPAAPAPPPPPPAPPAVVEEIVSSPAVKAYQQDVVEGPFAEFLSLSKQIGGIVEQHVSMLVPLLSAQQAFLQMASAHAKPAPNALVPLLKPQSEAITAIIEAKDKLGRTRDGRDWASALSVISEGVGGFGWVAIDQTPAPFVGEMKDAAQFWVNRVIKQFKDTNPTAVAWAKAFAPFLESLQKYVKQYHTTGVTWNPKGPAAPSTMPSSAPTSSGPPPPPPPPPADFAASASKSSAGGAAALLADLNKGGAITSGLKKVDPSQMTHKNPELRASSVVPDNIKKTPPPVKAKPGTVAAAKKPAKLELEDGTKWIVEYFEGKKDILIENAEIHQVVHIFGCQSSVIRISGKINAVTMVNCKKTALVLDSAVSSLSITSSPSFEVQITGSVPTILIDTTDSGQVYLSKACSETVEIVTSKTSSINVSIPSDQGEEGEFIEKPVPEQMKSRVVNGKLVTEIVEHAG